MQLFIIFALLLVGNEAQNAPEACRSSMKSRHVCVVCCALRLLTNLPTPLYTSLTLPMTVFRFKKLLSPMRCPLRNHLLLLPFSAASPPLAHDPPANL